MKNKWKLAFFILLSTIIVIVLTVFVLLFKDPEGVQFNKEGSGSEVPVSKKMMSIHTQKEQVEDLINKELKKKAPNVNAYVNLREEAVLNGTFVVFNRELPYQITFVPEVMKNGDLLLKEKDIQVGLFPLPGDEVFTLLKNTVSFPDWVDVFPAEEAILVRITEMKTKPGYAIKTEEFDLKKDSIQFGVYTAK
jgi:uncharacterized protein YpmS